MNGRVIVTTIDAVPPGVEVSIRTRSSVEDQNKKGDGAIELLYSDAETGLVFLSFDYKGKEKLGAISKEALREPKLGEKLFTVATQVLGDEVTGFNIFDGTVSALSHKDDDKVVMSIAMAANTGSSGAPLLNKQKALLGVVVGKFKGLVKTVNAIPGPEVLKAIERIPKK